MTEQEYAENNIIAVGKGKTHSILKYNGTGVAFNCSATYKLNFSKHTFI